MFSSLDSQAPLALALDWAFLESPSSPSEMSLHAQAPLHDPTGSYSDRDMFLQDIFESYSLQVALPPVPIANLRHSARLQDVGVVTQPPRGYVTLSLRGA